MGAKLASLSGVLGATQDRGLSFITSTTFSAASTVSVDNVFSASFDDYRIAIKWTGATGADMSMSMRLRAASTDAITNYASERIYHNSTTIGAGQNTGVDGTKARVGLLDATYPTRCAAWLDVINPFLAQATLIQGLTLGTNSSAINYGEVEHNWHTTATSYDGFSILCSGTNQTGVVTVWGYRKS